MTNPGASSRQNQSNIDDTQRNVVKKKVINYNPQLDLKRLITKNSLKNGLIINRRIL